MLGQSLQSLLNTYSGKTPTDFSDRFPGMRTKFAPGVRLPLSFLQKQKLGRSRRNISPSCICVDPVGDYTRLLLAAPPLPLRSLTPLSKEQVDMLQSRGTERGSHPGLNTQHATLEGCRAPKVQQCLGRTPGFGLL